MANKVEKEIEIESYPSVESHHNAVYFFCDLDGTLSLDFARIHHKMKSPPDYDAYHSTLHDDPVNMEVLAICHAMSAINPDARLIIMTARPEKYRDATRYWLHKWGLDPYDLWMRPHGNKDTSQHLKLKMLRSFFGGMVRARKQTITLIDDNPEVIAACSLNGISNSHVSTMFLCPSCVANHCIENGIEANVLGSPMLHFGGDKKQTIQ